MSEETNMFYGASPTIFEKAKMLRQNMTFHEKLLWEQLRSNKILGLRFKAQHPIDIFIADFYCHKLKLIIEIDGDSHNSADETAYDEGRSDEMQKLGIDTIRFSNDDIQNELSAVLRKLENKCKLLLNSDQLSTPTLKGEANLNLECKSPLEGVGGNKR
jgi:very-short-patch-repair endonuclease